MLKLWLVAAPILLLLGCSTAHKDPYQPVTLCKKINLAQDSPVVEYVIPSITSNNKQIIHIPLPPDLS